MPSMKKDNPADWVLKLRPPPHCSVGISSNEVIGFDGSVSQEGRENEDRSLVCCCGDTQLFMVLDGHEGSKAVKFVQTYLPHMLLQKELSVYDQSAKADISSAILATETQFFVSIDPYITRKVTLQIEIEQEVPDMNSSEASKLFPTQIAEIVRLDDLIKSGTTVVVALICRNKLYVANVGDSRALLCLHPPGEEERLTVKQLTVDHTTKNEDELRRLEKCGLDPVSLRTHGRLGTQQNTRSIGDYSIKGGYTNVDILKHAKTEPGTAEPYVHDPINISAFQGFLILMSDGLYKAYEEWSQRPDRINEDIAHLVSKELNNCRGGGDDSRVAQTVVEKVKHLFRDTHKRSRTRGRLDDITLIIKRLGPTYTSSVANVPQSAPVGIDRVFEFDNRHPSASINLPPTSYSGQPPYRHTHQQPPPTSSYHQTHHHQPPHVQASMPPSSSYQSASGLPENQQPSGRGHYNDYPDYDREGIPYSRQQAVDARYRYRDDVEYSHSRQQGMQQRPVSAEYPPYQDSQYHEGGSWPHRQQQQQQFGSGPGSMTNVQFSRVGSDQGGRRPVYSEASGQGNPRAYGPQGSYQPAPESERNRGYNYPQDYEGNTGSYVQRQDPSRRQQDGRYLQEGYGMQGQDHDQRQQQLHHPHQQQQYISGGNAGQPFQRDPYPTYRQGSSYQPGRDPSNESYRPEDWQGGYNGGQPSSASGPDPSYQPSGGFVLQTSASEDASDVATPVAVRQYSFANRQQSASSIASDTSSSSDLTLMRTPGMPPVGEVDTLKEDDLIGNETGSSAPSMGGTMGGASTGDGLQTGDGQGPGTQDSEGPHGVIYVSEDDEEPENQSLMDNDDIVKPYVKFGERFPSDLSWHDIPLVK